MPNRCFCKAAVALSILIGTPVARADQAAQSNRATEALVELIRAEIAAHRMVGAQLVIGHKTGRLFERCFGTRMIASAAPVDRDTRFCIGSCSKPLAAFCILRLWADKKLDLDDPIDRWLPEFRSPKLPNGKTARVPTVRELLAHRAGIYSQKELLTPRQRELIRNFRHPLSEAVRGIAAEPLIAEPGKQFAYSGAGYCVLGRVAEIAAEEPFDVILHRALCKPAGMTRTGYFVAADDPNVANGAVRRGGKLVVDPQAPHLTKPADRFALVGGSIYSTAPDLSKFARMLVGRGHVGDAIVLPGPAWEEYFKPQYPDQRYGLGWGLKTGPKGDVVGATHNGALFTYRALLALDLEHECFLVALVTLAGRGDEDAPNALAPITQAAQRALAEWAGVNETRPTRR